ncbi:DUF1622 domain-containing protein [Streptomyces sp. SID13726]|nr:DUF1622 domain-containing protein [Streptomyces sp. SID13726]NEA99781.1 DUF1622 domain-containing protein [Streptomyces sp. SID13726]
MLPESTLKDVVDTLVHLVEFAGALVIFVGALWTFVQLLRGAAPWSLRAGVREPHWEFNRIRLSLGRFLTLGLEFQLAGDILRTAIAPTFTEIGQLAAIAAIRTVLNFFLGKEIEKERKEVEQPAGERPAATPAAPS